MRPTDQVERCAEFLKLALHETPRGGTAGERLVARAGSSMEFHDRRPYTAGDDVRHVDWRAMARTDDVYVRVHQEEVEPRLDLIVDASRSMATDPAKEQLTVDLAAFFATSARADGQDVRVIVLGERAERVEFDRFMVEGVSSESRRPLPDVLEEALGLARPRSQRVLVSDFLVPMDAAALVRVLARDADRIALVQVLSSDDEHPRADGAVQLVDAETGQSREVLVTQAMVGEYELRLARLRSALADEVRRVGGVYGEATTPVALEEALVNLRGLVEVT